MEEKGKFRFGLYEANLDSGELFKNGQKVRLQEQPFQVLVALLERPGEVVTRDDLRQKLWPSDTFVDFEHSLNTAINKVRDALSDTAANPRFVETLPRRGYRFIAPVQRDAVVSQAARAQSAASAVPSGDATSGVPAPVVQQSGSVKTCTADIPRASRPVSRVLFGLLQVMYLVFYALALWRLQEIVDRGTTELGISGGLMLTIVLVTGTVGIALRLYTVNATLFDYELLGRKFQRLFLLILPLDLIWSLAPFLLVHILGLGLAFAACAALVYSPFAQRVLALMAWPRE